MSSGNWGDRFKSFLTGEKIDSSHRVSYWDLARSFSSLTINLILMIVLANMLIGVWSFYQDTEQRYRTNKQNAESETQQAYDKMAKRCAVAFPSEHFVRSCISDAIKSYEIQKNTDQDLQAQQDMAFWALCMFVATVGSLIISVGGLAMLFLSLRQTRTAIKDNREIGEKQTRAYFSVDLITGKNDDKWPSASDLFHPFEIEVRVKNVGQSPAREVRHVAFAGPVNLPKGGGCNDLLAPVEGGVSSSTSDLMHGEDFGLDLNAVVWGDVLQLLGPDSTSHFGVFGIVWYTDVFGVRQKKRFCFVATHETAMSEDQTGKLTRVYFSAANGHNDET